VARGRVATGGVDLLEDDARGGQRKALPLVLGGDQRRQPTAGRERPDELVRIAIRFQRAPVTAGEAPTQLADTVADSRKILG
jgi:hypothetical protein